VRDLGNESVVALHRESSAWIPNHFRKAICKILSVRSGERTASRGSVPLGHEPITLLDEPISTKTVGPRSWLRGLRAHGQISVLIIRCTTTARC